MTSNRRSSSKRKAVVLLSGGLDSAVALWWAKEKGFRCSALSIDYGQRHERELKSAAAIARAARVPLQVVRFSLPWGGSTLTDRKSRLPRHKLSQIGGAKIPSTYVPGRNTIFLSFAISWADQNRAQAVVIGANAIDYSGYPDCRPKYLKAFEKVANEGTRMGSQEKKRITIHAPLLRCTKEGIVKWGKRLGVPFHLTWSCYKGGKRPCGVCDSCLLRKKGFDSARIKDE